MGNTHKRYAPEYRQRMVELVRAGRNAEELAREFQTTSQSIRNWVAQEDRDEGRRSDGLTTAEREELSRLRRVPFVRVSHRGLSSSCPNLLLSTKPSQLHYDALVGRTARLA
jgi:transposase